MSKRFTDTDKWKRPWFRNLPMEYRLLWLYLCDNCDQAGIWYVDLELASFMLGKTITEEKALQLLNKQIEVSADKTRWKIVDFVPFQYGNLIPNNNLHKSVLRLQELWAISGTLQPQTNPKSDPENKVKIKPKEKIKHLEFVYLHDDEYQKLLSEFGQTLNEKIEKLNNYLGSTGKKYKSHYYTILNWARKESKETPNASNGSKSTFSYINLARSKRLAEETRIQTPTGTLPNGVRDKQNVQDDTSEYICRRDGETTDTLL